MKPLFHASISKFIVFPILLQQNSLFCQQGDKGNMSNHAGIYIAAGWHTTLFLDKHSIDDYAKKHIPNEYLNLTYFKGSLYTKNNFCYSIDYRTYAKATYGQNLEKGDVWERTYSAINIGFGKTFHRTKSITLTSNLYLSSRYGGAEWVLLYYSAAPQSQAVDMPFKYRSIGAGAGLAFTQKIYKGINFGLDLFYNHYFQKSVASRVPQGYEDYVKNYKINKDVLCLSLTLGFMLHTSAFKKSTTN